MPRYDRSNYNIINDGNASNNKDNEIACIKGNIIKKDYCIHNIHTTGTYFTVIRRIKKKETALIKKKSLSMKMVSGGAAIKKYAVLNDKRHILTKDTDNNVAIYDVLKVTKVKDLGQVDFDNELKQHNQKVFIPNWFTVDLKTGVCIIKISWMLKVSIVNVKKKKNIQNVLLLFVDTDADNRSGHRRSGLLLCMGLS